MTLAQFSCRAPNADYLGFEANPEAITAVAVRAEELGFDAILLNDHLIVDGTPRSAPWANTFDPLITLSYLAARTTRIRLGTSVLIMPYRNPIATAKQLATLDQLSGGRVIAGVGVGWSEAESDALGVPFRERGARTTEYLRVWQACWGPDPITFRGRFFSFTDMRARPKPRQEPHPPIWIGGGSDGALRRTAEFAQIWQPMQMPLEELGSRQSALQQACRQIGRSDVPPTRMSVRVGFREGAGVPGSGERLLGQGSVDQVVEDFRHLRAAGLDQFQINFMGCRSLSHLLESMALFMREVSPAVRA
jgi:probable F420-dependent oxidoreductase